MQRSLSFPVSRHQQKQEPQQSAVPDLISFDSWDFSATDSGTVSTCPSIESDQAHHSSSNKHNSKIHPDEDSEITVSVSGIPFQIHRSIFRQLEKLPWKWSDDGSTTITGVNQDDHQERNGTTQCPAIHTSPDLFEILLNYLLFDILPDLQQLSEAEVEELEPLAVVLGMPDLARHLENCGGRVGGPTLGRRLASFRRRAKNEQEPLPNDHLHPNQLPTRAFNETHPKVRPESSHNQMAIRRHHSLRNLSSSGMASSSTTMTSSRHQQNVADSSSEEIAQVDDHARHVVMLRRFQAAVGRKKMGGRGERNLTHAEWCASNLVD